MSQTSIRTHDKCNDDFYFQGLEQIVSAHNRWPKAGTAEILSVKFFESINIRKESSFPLVVSSTGSLTNRNLLHTVLEIQSKIKVPEGLVSGRLHVSMMSPWCCSLWGKGMLGPHMMEGIKTQKGQRSSTPLILCHDEGVTSLLLMILPLPLSNWWFGFNVRISGTHSDHSIPLDNFIPALYGKCVTSHLNLSLASRK